MSIIIWSIFGLIAVLVCVLMFVNRRFVIYKEDYKICAEDLHFHLSARYELLSQLSGCVNTLTPEANSGFKALITEFNEIITLNKTMLNQFRYDRASLKSCEMVLNAETFLRITIENFTYAIQNYPQLKTNEKINELIEELAANEDMVIYSRNEFNKYVRKFEKYYAEKSLRGWLSKHQRVGRVIRINTNQFKKLLLNWLQKDVTKQVELTEMLADFGAVIRLQDRDEVCACNRVNKRTIVNAIVDHHLSTVFEVREITKASGSCGSCTQMVGDILRFTLEQQKKSAQTRVLAGTKPL